MTDDEHTATTWPPSPDPVPRDSPAGDMVKAVQSGSVIYGPRAGRSGWASPFHTTGFTHIGLGVNTSRQWGDVEQTALEECAEAGLVALRRQMHWVLTPAGRELYWRWTHPVEEARSTPQLDEPS